MLQTKSSLKTHNSWSLCWLISPVLRGQGIPYKHRGKYEGHGSVNPVYNPSVSCVRFGGGPILLLAYKTEREEGRLSVDSLWNVEDGVIAH